VADKAKMIQITTERKGMGVIDNKIFEFSMGNLPALLKSAATILMIPVLKRKTFAQLPQGALVIILLIS
jgi:hypothetical protein